MLLPNSSLALDFRHRQAHFPNPIRFCKDEFVTWAGKAAGVERR